MLWDLNDDDPDERGPKVRGELHRIHGMDGRGREQARTRRWSELPGPRTGTLRISAAERAASSR